MISNKNSQRYLNAIFLIGVFVLVRSGRADEESASPVSANEVILETILSGSLEDLSQALRTVSDVNSLIFEGAKVLHVAVSSGDVEKVNFLIDKGADVNARDTMRRTPLHECVASFLGLQCLEVLLTAGAKPDAKDVAGRSPLHILVGMGGGDDLVDSAKTLLSRGADVNSADQHGLTPFHMSCGYGAVKLTGLFVNSGAALGQQDVDGWSALHFAANNGVAEVSRILTAKGADVDVRTKDGWSSLALAANEGHAEVVAALTAVGAVESSWKPLHLASVQEPLMEGPSATELVKKSLEDLDARDRYGRTALVWSICSGAEDLTRALLAANADVKIVDQVGFSALHGAARDGSIEILRLLLQRGALTGIADRDGWLPLHFAAAFRHGACVQALVEKSADVSVKTGDGVTALHFAAADQQEEIVEILVKAGANPLAKDAAGYLPSDLGAFDVLMRAQVKEQYSRLSRILAEKEKRSASGTSSPPGKIAAVSPGAVLKKMARALYFPDRQAFLACFQGSDQDRHVIGMIFDMVQSGLALRKSFVDRYGVEKWLDFQMPGGMHLQFPVIEERVLDAIEIEIKGEQATCSPIEGLPHIGALGLDKSTDGLWAIQAADMNPGGVDPILFSRLLTAVRDAKVAIDEGQVKVETLEDEMLEKIFAEE